MRPKNSKNKLPVLFWVVVVARWGWTGLKAGLRQWILRDLPRI